MYVFYVHLYARVSTLGQNLDTQLKQLQDYGCEKIYKVKVNGRTKKLRNFKLC
ncbi:MULTISPECIES: recombinase family protein [Paenibacillus]|uniref:recombinase family protein n=1 Tax=Paenibacillus TaxID=44249 RepID=UPI001352F45C|nr:MULTISPECIES: recombinase family protein [Paenibacillus]MDY8025810.1 recombinase family protein [Paenibacillus polymyxa]MXO77698.1 hypothetical protein [Paenibacillus sp. OT2-17]